MQSVEGDNSRLWRNVSPQPPPAISVTRYNSEPGSHDDYAGHAGKFVALAVRCVADDNNAGYAGLSPLFRSGINTRVIAMTVMLVMRIGLLRSG